MSAFGVLGSFATASLIKRVPTTRLSRIRLFWAVVHLHRLRFIRGPVAARIGEILRLRSGHGLPHQLWLGLDSALLTCLATKSIIIGPVKRVPWRRWKHWY